MTNQESAIVFGRKMAANYDKGNAVFAPIRDSLNFIVRTILAELPTDARILCVGVGTGSELIVGVASPRRISRKHFPNGNSQR
jgi:tRNA (cmo5U34)-methyltransferase